MNTMLIYRFLFRWWTLLFRIILFSRWWFNVLI